MEKPDAPATTKSDEATLAVILPTNMWHRRNFDTASPTPVTTVMAAARRSVPVGNGQSQVRSCQTMRLLDWSSGG
jgi:hypothetical protein